MAADAGAIEHPSPLGLDQTLTPGVYRIINDESSNIVVDLSGYDKTSILGKFRSRIHKQQGETVLTVRTAYEAHEGGNQKV
jgi:hypothetical protein